MKEIVVWVFGGIGRLIGVVWKAVKWTIQKVWSALTLPIRLIRKLFEFIVMNYLIRFPIGIVPSLSKTPFFVRTSRLTKP